MRSSSQDSVRNPKEVKANLLLHPRQYGKYRNTSSPSGTLGNLNQKRMLWTAFKDRLGFEAGPFDLQGQRQE